jgi:hypothetical protein
MKKTFDINPYGIDFDPEELCAAIDRGVPEAKLKEQNDRSVRNKPEDMMELVAKMNAANPGV